VALVSNPSVFDLMSGYDSIRSSLDPRKNSNPVSESLYEHGTNTRILDWIEFAVYLDA